MCFGVLHAVCFKIFDSDHDGLLSRDELEAMIAAMMVVRKENRTQQQLVRGDRGFQTPGGLFCHRIILERNNTENCIIIHMGSVISPQPVIRIL